MKLATTTADFSRFYSSHSDSIRAVKRAGFNFVDFSFYNEANADSPFISDSWERYTYDLLECAKKEELTFVQSHLPGWNILDKNADQDFYEFVVKRCLYACKILSIPTAVIHTGWAPGVGKEEYFERNISYLSKFFPVMEETGVRILVENSTRANMGELYFFYTGQDMAEFLDQAAHPLLGACWDTGHANIEGHQYEDLIALGKRYLWGIHFNDNNGMADEHIAPFYGTMNIDECMRGLIDSGYAGPFVFESNTWPNTIKLYDKDMRELKSISIKLKDRAESMLYSIGEYILDSYGLLEK